MKLAVKINNRLNEEIRVSLPKALTERFGEHNFQTQYNIFAMALTTNWDDDVSAEMAHEIKLFVEGYDSAFTTAMKTVGEFE